ncbi:GNAT family N-acetyltransferase [Colwellia sp. 6M3]|uniref:GNAT family N-acetyltransferase n=1 Tax=Colwellia sp. 6M3 TaxID=2759849 RepID=UPI0015F66388|nr:GNAT family N-acetyltransferase [Colwellia sp. 6M3]MBA6417382.1 GNAT family N-acetyltransferase [Colwellia sp. 6M3]
MKPTPSLLNDNSVEVSEIEESIVTTFSDFILLENHWNLFLDKQPSSLLCVEWTWIKNWIEVYFRKNDTLFICTYWFKQQLVGVIPCYIKKGRFINELRFIATGENEVDEVCSEFQDFIIESNFKSEVFAKFSKIVTKHAIKKASFENILPKSNIYDWLKSLNHSIWIKQEEINGFRYCVDVFEESKLIADLPGKTLRRKIRSIAKTNIYQIELLDNSANFDDFYQQLKVNHQSVWHEKGKVGAFSSDKFTEFHKNYARDMLLKKKLVMFKLSYQNEVLAVFYGLIKGNILFYYQSGIKRVDGHNSLGAAMHYCAIDLAYKQGLKKYDLMRGSIDSYKQQYCFPTTATSNIYLIRRTLCYIPIVQSIISFIKTSIKRVVY